MVDFLIMSLLVTLCLERNPGKQTGPATGLCVATGQTTNVVYEARIIGMRVER